MMRVKRRVIVLTLLGLVAVSLEAQRRRFFGGDFPVEGNPSYDGRFTFTRMRWAGYGGMTNEGPGWMHDYPRGERNLAKILSEVSALKPNLDSSNVLDFNDKQLFRNPIAYLSEPGYWDPTDDDVKALREFLLKGGFLIVDDFRTFHMANLELQMLRVLPNARWIEIEPGSAVWDAFFRIDADDLQQPGIYGPPIAYLGIFEDNDPKKRLMVVANYNNDIGDAWQWSAEGFIPIEITNEAFKLGVNYVMYAMTH